MKNNTVLFVDDEPLILNSLKRECLKEEYMSLFASSGKEALELMENKKINVIVTDIRMPRMNGLELLKIIKNKYPDVTRIVYSGYTQLPQVIEIINNGDIFKFIRKPWKFDEEFKPAINEAIKFNNIKLKQKELLQELSQRNQIITKELNSNKDNTIKQEIKKIKEFNTNGLNIIKLVNLGSEDVEELKNHIIEVYQEYLNSYLDLIPLTISKFNVSNLVKILQEYVEEKYKSQLTINLIGNLEYNLETDYKFLFWILKQLVKILIEYNQDEQSILAIMVNDKIDIVQISFVTKINITQRNLNNHRDKVLLESQIKLLKELIRGFSCNINYRLNKDHIYIEFYMNCVKKKNKNPI